MSAIVDILNGALETEAELAAARAGLTLPLIKVAITEYLAEEKGVASWTKLAGVVVARDKSLKAVIAIVDENAAAAKFDDREAQNRMAAAFGTVGTLACIRSWALWSIEEAEQDAAALFGSFYDHDSELVDDLKEAVNYPLDLLRNNIVARAAATCGEITNLLGQYNSSKNKNALGVYRVGLETTFGSLKHYCVSEVALAKEKVRLYFENMALGYVSVGRPDRKCSNKVPRHILTLLRPIQSLRDPA